MTCVFILHSYVCGHVCGVFTSKIRFYQLSVYTVNKNLVVHEFYFNVTV